MDMAERLQPMPDSLDTESGRGDRRVHLATFRAIRARDAQVLQALGFALAHADPFPMLRGLAADLGGETLPDRALGDRSPCPCRRCGGPVEDSRLCYAQPPCFACLPPPGSIPPPTLPGPTERVDMALRLQYRYGCFTVPDGNPFAGTVSTPAHYRVHGLSIRIVYEHSAADAEAAQDCAESWRSRMLGAGAREVECVGEVVT